jgi:hypothetical protein
MASMAKTAATAGAILALSGMVGAVSGCGSSDSGSSSATSQAAIGASAAGSAAVDHREASAAKDLALPAAVTEPLSVIKTATLELRIPRNRMQRQIVAATAIANAAGGYVQTSSQQSSHTSSADIVIRVPADAFGTAVNRLKGLGTVKSSTIGGDDVTRQLIDLNARLVNLQAQRRVLLRLMQKAGTIAASILVENQLSQVQGGIEQLSGQLRYIHDRADFSTITLSMMTAGAVAPAPQHASSLWQAMTRSLDAAQSVVTAVIVGLGFVLPIALLLGLAAILARRFWPGLVAKSRVQE